jgi:hypothetical protein
MLLLLVVVKVVTVMGNQHPNGPAVAVAAQEVTETELSHPLHPDLTL